MYVLMCVCLFTKLLLTVIFTLYWCLLFCRHMRLLVPLETRASCAVLHSSDGVDPRGDTGSLRSPTRVALSRSVAIDQNTTEDDQLQEGLDPLRIYPDRQPTLRTAEEELPIVVPCSRLMAISRRLRSNLTQLMVRTLSHDSPTCTLIILLWSQIT